MTPLEIERKWIVTNWPSHDFPLLYSEVMQQGYISVEPTVRIRQEKTIQSNLDTHPIQNNYVLCVKSHGLLTRKEVEIMIEEEKFEQLKDVIDYPLIHKIRNTYLLPNGKHLEVNHVDQGLDSEFWYAEIEFQSEEDALTFDPKSVGLESYLTNDVTTQKNQSMAAYWMQTRMR